MKLTAAKQYTSMAQDRLPYLTRAWDGAELTIPFLLPRNGRKDRKLPTPYHNIGARGVNNLTAKLLLTMFPANEPFYRYQIDDATLEGLTKKQGGRAAVEKGLASIERAILQAFEEQLIRPGLYEALRHLIVTGNILIFKQPKNKGIRVFHLDQYVVERDPDGEVLKIIIEEEISRVVFNEIFDKPIPNPEVGTKKKESATIKVYTIVRRKDKKWLVHQEDEDGLIIPGTTGTFPLEKGRWIALRFNRIDGENYGRGFVEEHIGALRSAEGLAKALLESAAAAARVLFLVRPNSTTNMRTISQAPNLAVRSGDAQDISTLQLEKFNDLNVARSTLERIEPQLAAAFLMNQSVQRDAERVTAEEVRFMAQELETSFGGLYSLLAHDLQFPLVRLTQFDLEKTNKLPKLPDDVAKPVIITGFEALGRGNNANKLITFVKTLTGTLGPEVTATYLIVSDFVTRLGTGIGIDTNGLIKSEEVVKQETEAKQAALQRQAMIEKLGPAGIKEGSALLQASGRVGAQQPTT